MKATAACKKGRKFKVRAFSPIWWGGCCGFLALMYLLYFMLYAIMF